MVDSLPDRRTQRVAEFLAKARPPGRLIFALDATYSRQPTWDMACHLHGEMFAEVGKIGGLEVQLVYFRGRDQFNHSALDSE